MLSLDPGSINGFDRWATEIDVAERGASQVRSDVLLCSSACAPLALLFDREVRKEWAPVFTLYEEVMLATCARRSGTAIAAEVPGPVLGQQGP